LGITCVVLLAACGLVIVDMLLTFAVTGAVLGFYAFCQEQDKQRRKAWSVWTAGMLGIGFMTKGPIVLVMVGLPVLIWSLLFRRWQDLRTQQWYLGITLFGLMVAPWFIAAELRSPGFLRYFFINENLLRFVVHEYGDRYGDGHIYPRGTAVLMMLLAAAPWSIVGPIQFFKNRKILSFALLRKDPLLMYFLLVVVVNTLFLAMARQLLMTYLFPLVPAYLVFLAMLRERVLQLSFFDERKISSAGVALVAGVAVVGMLAVPYSMGCSTKSILTKAQAYKKAGEKIYFVRRVPFSAYYYAPADVLPHPDESVDVSLKTVLERKDPVLVVSHEEYFRPFKALPRADRISQLTQSGNYVLAQIETTPEITDRQQHAGL
jgi:4-amino-4-deoxy-L-arabinose transferase-like glycosyltransferase